MVSDFCHNRVDGSGTGINTDHAGIDAGKDRNRNQCVNRKEEPSWICCCMEEIFWEVSWSVISCWVIRGAWSVSSPLESIRAIAETKRPEAILRYNGLMTGRREKILDNVFDRKVSSAKQAQMIIRSRIKPVNTWSDYSNNQNRNPLILWEKLDISVPSWLNTWRKIGSTLIIRTPITTAIIKIAWSLDRWPHCDTFGNIFAAFIVFGQGNPEPLPVYRKFHRSPPFPPYTVESVGLSERKSKRLSLFNWFQICFKEFLFCLRGSVFVKNVDSFLKRDTGFDQQRKLGAEGSNLQRRKIFGWAVQPCCPPFTDPWIFSKHTLLCSFSISDYTSWWKRCCFRWKRRSSPCRPRILPSK